MENYIKLSSGKVKVIDVPQYIKIFPMGLVTSEKGSFIVDAESFREMKDHMLKRGIDIVIDYEHQTLTGAQAPAGGWVKELILNNGIYAKVEWTEKAQQYLKKQEYRYLSPVVLIRETDKKAVQLHSIALTNTPAMHGLTPIINSKTFLPASLQKASDEMSGTIYRMLNLTQNDVRLYGKVDKEYE